VKLIEAMKKLRLIEKRLQAQCGQINDYAAILSTERPAYKSEKEQTVAVQGFVQSNLDLVEEYLKLKQSIELTNLKTTVTIQGKVHSISALLVLKRRLGSQIVATFRALNDQGARARLRQGTGPMTNDAVQINRLYDEGEKNKKLREWEDVLNEIDSRLEIVNATTELTNLD